MRTFITYLLLGVLLGTMPSLLLAQQDQNTQKSDTEIETLKKRVSELEERFQDLDNIKKMDLQAKLAEANTKLINAEVDKYKWELRDSNHKWLTGWILFFLAILAAIGVGAWSWLKSRTNQLIETEVAKNINGFKEAVEAQDLIKNQLKGLEIESATSTLRDFARIRLGEEHHHPKEIKALPDEILLEIFADEKHHPVFRNKVAEILAARKCPQLIFSLLKYLNSVVDSDSDIYWQLESHMRSYITFFTRINTPEVYQVLREFLNRLLMENPKNKDLFLVETVFSLTWVSVKLNIGDSVPLLKMAIPHLKDLEPADLKALEDVAKYFDIFNDSAGIIDILNHHAAGEIPGLESSQSQLENRCLELLQKHDPEFVENGEQKDQRIIATHKESS